MCINALETRVLGLSAAQQREMQQERKEAEKQVWAAMVKEFLTGRHQSRLGPRRTCA